MRFAKTGISLLGAIACTALAGCAATPVFEGSPPPADKVADLRVTSRVFGLNVDGQESWGRHFVMTGGTHRIEATIAGNAKPVAPLGGARVKLVHECEGRVDLDEGVSYRVRSRPGSQFAELPDSTNGNVELTRVHAIILEILALPEEDPIARVPCGAPSYELVHDAAKASL